MNFNDIQSAWDNDREKGGNIPNRIDQLKAAGLPLDKVRGNLRNEFVYQAAAIVFVAFLPQIHSFNPALYVWYYVTYAIFTAISVYYLVKLFRFYKRLQRTEINTKDSLYETYYEIRLNIEIYKTFSFSLMPFVLIFLLMFIVSVNKSAVLEMIQTGLFPQTLVIQFAVGFIISMLAMALATEWWVRHFYGRYAAEIKKLINQLKEE